MNTVSATQGRSDAVSAVARVDWERDWDKALTKDGGWQERALCRGADANLFFPPQNPELKDERLAREAQAKAICSECPVRRQCLEFALATREPHGIWGGLNELERRRLVRDQVRRLHAVSDA